MLVELVSIQFIVIDLKAFTGVVALIGERAKQAKPHTNHENEIFICMYTYVN